MTLTARRGFVVVLIGVVGLYVALSIGMALTRQPWCDEAWFASPAYNLTKSGSMGTSILEGSGPQGTDGGTERLKGTWKGLDRHTYWQPPMHFLVSAVWYVLFGLSLLSVRVLSCVWGGVALLSWGVIVWKLSRNRGVALLAFALISVDYYFLLSSADGRMDMMCAALGFAGFAAYLAGREGKFALSVVLSHTLVALACLTHPNGVLVLAGLVFLQIYLDRQRLRVRHVLLGAVPYLVAAAAWGGYILQDSSAFTAQFRGNLSDKTYGMESPWVGLKREVMDRYLKSFGFGPTTPLAGKLKLLILAGYLLAVPATLFSSSLRKRKAEFAVALLAVLYLVLMTFVIGNKTCYYLVHITPIFSAALAIWVGWCWSNRRLPRWLIAGGMFGFILLQVGGDLHRIKGDTYRRYYVPAMDVLKASTADGHLIMGSAELAFELGFDGAVLDDPRLGCFTGKTPDLIVVEPRYRNWFAGFRAAEPNVDRHITELLESTFRCVYDNGFYEIYAPSSVSSMHSAALASHSAN